MKFVYDRDKWWSKDAKSDLLMGYLGATTPPPPPPKSTSATTTTTTTWKMFNKVAAL